MPLTSRESAALDRHITGNWGEDSVPPELPCLCQEPDAEEYELCPECARDQHESEQEDEAMDPTL